MSALDAVSSGLIQMSSCQPVNGQWTLADAHMPKDAGTVFSCFACAGGSSMGYKLAGFDVVGCNEIDPDVFRIYNLNHKPQHPFVCSIRDMLDKDLPVELHQLDILDGSPPCTSFSTAGVRERDWGKTKRFAEGQALQRLDDLFFEFIALAQKLQPKIVISENVTGIIKGKAKGYVKEIVQAFKDAGYSTQIFDLNAGTMGVAQARRRIFFVSRRDDLKLKPIRLSFKEKPITFREVTTWLGPQPAIPMSNCYRELWKKCRPGDSFSTVHPTGSYFSARRWSMNKPAPTLVSGSYDCQFHPSQPRQISQDEWNACSSFPTDMKWGGWDTRKIKWATGMSVPPLMTQRIALQIIKQWGHAIGGENGKTNEAQ